MIYTVYAEKDDITFIMEQTEDKMRCDAKIEVIGFYFGEPNKESTKKFAGKSQATITLAEMHKKV